MTTVCNGLASSRSCWALSCLPLTLSTAQDYCSLSKEETEIRCNG